VLAIDSASNCGAEKTPQPGNNAVSSNIIGTRRKPLFHFIVRSLSDDAVPARAGIAAHALRLG
jgi:hypothetical protein